MEQAVPGAWPLLLMEADLKLVLPRVVGRGGSLGTRPNPEKMLRCEESPARGALATGAGDWLSWQRGGVAAV